MRPRPFFKIVVFVSLFIYFLYFFFSDHFAADEPKRTSGFEKLQDGHVTDGKGVLPIENELEKIKFLAQDDPGGELNEVLSQDLKAPTGEKLEQRGATTPNTVVLPKPNEFKPKVPFVDAQRTAPRHEEIIVQQSVKKTNLIPTQNVPIAQSVGEMKELPSSTILGCPKLDQNQSIPVGSINLEMTRNKLLPSLKSNPKFDGNQIPNPKFEGNQIPNPKFEGNQIPNPINSETTISRPNMQGNSHQPSDIKPP